MRDPVIFLIEALEIIAEMDFDATPFSHAAARAKAKSALAAYHHHRAFISEMMSKEEPDARAD